MAGKRTGKAGKASRPKAPRDPLKTASGQPYTYLGWVRKYNEARRVLDGDAKRTNNAVSSAPLEALRRAYPAHWEQYKREHQIQEGLHMTRPPAWAKGATPDELRAFTERVRKINAEARERSQVAKRNERERLKHASKQEKDDAARRRYEQMTPAARRKREDKRRIQASEKRHALQPVKQMSIKDLEREKKQLSDEVTVIYRRNGPADIFHDVTGEDAPEFQRKMSRLNDVRYELERRERKIRDLRSFLEHTGGKHGDKSTDGKRRRAAAKAQLTKLTH